jgi:hypoxanthine phosphoribosyltransferase
MATDSHNLHQDIVKVLYSEQDLLKSCQVLGKGIAKDYQDREPLFLITLSGAYVFAADLLRQVQPTPIGTSVDFIRASSYGGGIQSSGVVRLQVQFFAASCEQIWHSNLLECSRVTIYLLVLMLPLH